MILICKSNGVWHLVGALEKTGLASITITAYCGDENDNGVQQVPDKYITRVCGKCQLALEKV